MAKKLKKFLILLDNENLLYFPGSFLTGKVLLELEDETPALGSYSQFEECRAQRGKGVRRRGGIPARRGLTWVLGLSVCLTG